MRARATPLLLPLFLACCGASRPAGPVPVLTDLKSVDDFAARFDAGAGSPRIVLLMSPT